MAKIVIVDEEKHIREWYSHELSVQGHKVTSVESSRNIINQMEAFQADLIILDIGLIDPDDLERFHHIRNNGHESPLIIWTAYHPCEFENTRIPLDYCLVKSYDMTEMNSKLQSALGASAPPRSRQIV